MSMMSYQHMALLYDKLMVEAPYDLWLTFTENVFDHYGKNISRIADLGCGTGEITTRLAEKGYNMVGVDYSADMLTIAEQKASEKNLSIQWLNQDLIHLDGLKMMDVALSYCDVINYITEEEELEKVFNNVARMLNEGGLFVFDIHSLHHMENNLANQTFADVTDDSSYIWFCTQGDHPGEVYHDLTFYSLDSTNQYIRFDETHHQRTYTVQFYEKLLYQAGFQNIKFYGDFTLETTKSQENSERIFIIAEKRSR